MSANGAILSNSRTWRYLLWRIWDRDKPVVLFILLNPSVANEYKDDPTIRRCIGFAKAWGYGGILVANLFAYRATDPAVMKDAHDPIGPKNDITIRRAAKRSDLIICAWGVNGNHIFRDFEVRDMLTKKYNLYCLGTTKHNMPRHPLYLRANTKPVIFREKDGGKE